MQPYKHHSNVPGGIDRSVKKQFIYVYSFALNPEEYQPSGSYNFGRLNDRTNFEFTEEQEVFNKGDKIEQTFTYVEYFKFTNKY